MPGEPSHMGEAAAMGETMLVGEPRHMGEASNLSMPPHVGEVVMTGQPSYMVEDTSMGDPRPMGEAVLVGETSNLNMPRHMDEVFTECDARFCGMSIPPHPLWIEVSLQLGISQFIPIVVTSQGFFSRWTGLG